MDQPVPAAVVAAGMKAQLAGPLQACKARQKKHQKRYRPYRPRTPSLNLDEGTVFAFLNEKADDVLYQNIKRAFDRQPGDVLEMINKSEWWWRCPPLVELLATQDTQNLNLQLFSHDMLEKLGWTSEDLQQLCDTVSKNCKDSLQTLEIEQFYCNPKEVRKRPVLSVSQMGSMLLQLRALTTFKLHCRECTPQDSDVLISNLATSNPNIRSLKIPSLTAKSLAIIARRWPKLEHLESIGHKDMFTARNVVAALYKLRCLRTLKIPESIQYKAMRMVAKAPNPGTWPLERSFIIPRKVPFNRRDIWRIFLCFPYLEEINMEDNKIPLVLTGLEQLEDRPTKLTYLEVQTYYPKVYCLHPLLDNSMGENLTKLHVNGFPFPKNPVDVALIGHSCKRVEDLFISAEVLKASSYFQIDSTYFCKLTTFVLRHRARGPNLQRYGPAKLPKKLVCCMLAGPGLVSFDSRGLLISEEVVSTLGEESREGGALSSLKEVTIWHRDVSAMAVAKISCYAPRLHDVNLVYYKQPPQELKVKRDVINEFIKRSDRPLELTLRKRRLCEN